MKISEVKITDIIQDDKNLNKGTADGKAMITKSLQKFGAGRSILLDKNNRIIAGNKTHENAEEIGMENVIVVESDGSKLVAVKRTDIDLDSKEGREMALAAQGESFTYEDGYTKLEILNARQIPIYARKYYNILHGDEKSYNTCRNWRFAYQMTFGF